MPERIRFTALFANGAMVVIFGFVAFYTLGQGQWPLGIFFVLLALAAGFSFHVIRKAAHLLSEEQWLLAELRKAELRSRLAELGRDDAAPTSRPEQGPPA